MNWSQGILVVVGLFVLRVGVPLGVTILVVRLLHHLEARWQSEA